MQELKVVYELHPVTPERKAELRAQGYKIIDARFAPADYNPTEAADTNDDGKLTVAEIREALTVRGIEFDPKAKKTDLLALLEQSQG